MFQLVSSPCGSHSLSHRSRLVGRTGSRLWPKSSMFEHNLGIGPNGLFLRLWRHLRIHPQHQGRLCPRWPTNGEWQRENSFIFHLFQVCCCASVDGCNFGPGGPLPKVANQTRPLAGLSPVALKSSPALHFLKKLDASGGTNFWWIMMPSIEGNAMNNDMGREIRVPSMNVVVPFINPQILPIYHTNLLTNSIAQQEDDIRLCARKWKIIFLNKLKYNARLIFGNSREF